MGRAPCCEKIGLKRGPWTKDEDQLLINYINENGHGNWRALPKKAGLLRCGKSCRLRWTNYLRPDIKRGNFTKEEEDSIIDLHKELGNKWSAIAARLPGRTDNEIKNIWHTHLKKRLNPPPEIVKRVRKRSKPNPNIKKDVEMSCQDHEHTHKEDHVDTHTHKSEERDDSHNVKNDEPNSPSQTSSENSTVTTATTINGGGGSGGGGGGGGNASSSSTTISDVISLEKFLEVDDDDFWADVISGDNSNITTDLPAVNSEPHFQSTEGHVYGFDPNMPDEDMEFWHNIFTRDGEIQDLLDF